MAEAGFEPRRPALRLGMKNRQKGGPFPGYLNAIAVPQLDRSHHISSPLSSGEHHLDSTLSGNELVHDIAVDVGEAEVSAVVAEGEPLVIQAQQVEDGGVEVVMRDSVLDGVHAELVGGAVGNALA